MATLTSTKIKNTYDALLKSIDNDAIGTTAKQITDGLGNVTPLYVSTTQVGIGVTPESGLNLHVYGDAKIGSNLTVIGNLVVEGSTTTVGTDTLTVKDPLIVLANNNTSTDAVDIGFYGKYTPSGTTLYSGLFREALTGKYRLFKDLQVEPTTTVNTSGTGYAQATLIAALEGDVTGNLTGNVTGNVTGDLTGDVTGDVTGDLTGNVTGGTISGTTGTFSGNVDIDGTLDVDDVISVEGSAFGRIEIGGASGGYIDLKAPNSDDYDFRLITSTGGAELYSIDTLKFYTGATTDLAFSIDASQNATFENNVTIPETPTADTHAASKGYVDAAVEGQDTLAEILANGNTTGGTDIAVSANDDITFADNSKIIFGDSGDIEMFFDGGTFVIDDTLEVQQGIDIDTNRVRFRGTDLYMEIGNAQHTFWTNGTQRLQINSSGVNVSSDFTVNTDTLFVDYSADSVGIGLTNPADYTADELVISVPDGSGMTLVSGSTDAAYITFMSSTGAIATNGGYIGYDHDNDTLTNFAQSKVSIAILEAEVAYFTDTAFFVDKNTTLDENLIVNGNVGIGETSPDKLLHLKSSGATGIAIESTTNSQSLDIDFYNNVGSAQGRIRYEEGAGAFNISPNVSSPNAMYINYSNNVGIGTTDPEQKLHVEGASITVNRGNDDSSIAFQNSTSGATWRIGRDYSNSEALTFAYSATDYPSLTGNGLIYINTSGDVGIGATSPAEKLDVNGSINLRGGQIYAAADGSNTFFANAVQHIFRAGSSGSYAERMRIDSSGNVGIGTDSPRNDANFVTLQVGNTTTAASQIVLDDNDSNGPWRIISNQSLIINDDATERMRIDSSGLVRIQKNTASTTEPLLKLSNASGSTTDGVKMIFEVANTSGNGGEIAVVRDGGSFNPYMTFNVSSGVASAPTERMRIADTLITFPTVTELRGDIGSNKFAIGNMGDASSQMMVSSRGFITFNVSNTGSAKDAQERMRIDSSGALTVSTAASTIATFKATGSGQNEKQLIIDTGGDRVILDAQTTAGANTNFAFSTGGTERMRIDSSGNVGIGTTSPSTKLDVAGEISSSDDINVNNGKLVVNHTSAEVRIKSSSDTGESYISFSDPSDINPGQIYYGHTDNAMRFRTNDAERMRIESDGSLKVPSVHSQTTNIGANVVVLSDGELLRSTSSLKYKTDVRDYDKGLNEVMQLQPKYYKGKNDESETQFAGLIAEDVHDLGLTEFVQYADDGSPDALSYSNMIALLTKSIQELKAEIELLKTQINN